MKKIINYFIEHALVTNIITVALLVIGGLTLYGLQKEVFPDVDLDIVVVTTPYPGASSEDVEELVTIPLERAIKQVEGNRGTQCPLFRKPIDSFYQGNAR